MNGEYEQHIVKELCPTVGVAEVEVGVPVCIKAFAHVGKVKTQCIGKADIIPDTDICKGKPDNVCKFVISQKIKVEIPVMFGAKTEVGEASVDCDCPKGEVCCSIEK